DQIGARCQIATFRGSLNAFKPNPLAVGPRVACPERSLPRAVGLAVVYPQSRTGWQISVDGLTITALDAPSVDERLTHVSQGTYCALDPSVQDGTPVPYLDAVPPSVTCFPWPAPTPGPGGPGVGAASGLTLRQ